jgi:hypothetical protein
MNELDESYAPAIRINTQKLKEWPPEQHDPRRILELDGLLEKIEDILKEKYNLNRLQILYLTSCRCSLLSKSRIWSPTHRLRQNGTISQPPRQLKVFI